MTRDFTKNRFRLLSLIIIIIGAISVGGSACKTTENPSSSNANTVNPQIDNYRIVGYVAGWKADWTTGKIDANKLTHINYAFGDIKDNKLVSVNPTDSVNFLVMDSLKKENPDLKVLISVGGWTRSDHFSDAALTDESRATFAKSAVNFIKKYHLDGVDLDWEYPGMQGEDNMFRAADKHNFTLFVKKLREELDRQSRIDGRTGDDKYQLTMAAGGSKGFTWHTEMGEVQKYLDFINLMSYDYHTGGTSVTGHHTNLYPSHSPNWTGSSAEQSVNYFMDAGVPSHKLVLGVAFYGRYWAGGGTADHGLYQWAKDSRTGGFSFDSLQANYINKNGFHRYWDEAAKAPYLWNPDKKMFITYDDTESLRYKAKFIKEKGLSGAMFWEYSQDMKETLLDALNQDLNKKKKTLQGF